MEVDSDDDEAPVAIVKSGSSSPKQRGEAVKDDSRFKEYRVYQAQSMLNDDNVAPKSSYEVGNTSPTLPTSHSNTSNPTQTRTPPRCSDLLMHKPHNPSFS